MTTPQGCACPPPRTHDGFYLRLTLGLGGGSASGAGTKYSGTSLGSSAAFGGALTQHLVLYGEFLLLGISNPKGGTKGVYPTLVGNPIDNIGLGPGIAYYFTPLNLYLSATLFLQKVLLVKSYDVGSEMQFTKTGLGLSLMVGKEWWVSANWGLGVAAQLLLASAKDDSDTKWDLGVLALMFTSTYN